MCITTRHAYDARRSRKMSDSSPKNMKITLGLMISTKSPVSSLRQTLHHQDRSTDSCIGVIEVETVRHRFDTAEMSWVRSVLGPKCLDTLGLGLGHSRVLARCASGLDPFLFALFFKH